TLDRALMPRKFSGRIPVRKSSHDPLRPMSSPSSAVSVVLFPGLATRATPSPMTTDASAVIPNHRRVCPARRAALVTFRRLATEAMIAVMISGGTSACSRPMNDDPMVSKVTVSQLGSSSPTGPISRARSPSPTPRKSAMMIGVPNEGNHFGRVLALVFLGAADVSGCSFCSVSATLVGLSHDKIRDDEWSSIDGHAQASQHNWVVSTRVSTEKGALGLTTEKKEGELRP